MFQYYDKRSDTFKLPKCTEMFTDCYFKTMILICTTLKNNIY